MLSKFRFHCKFQEMGCEELFYYDTLSQHEQNCPYELVICDTCHIQLRIQEKPSHNCVQSLKSEVLQLQKTSKARVLFYAEGGNKDYWVFDEATLEWHKSAIKGDLYSFPILAQFVVLNHTAKSRVFALGGIKEQIFSKNEGNKVITETLTQPCKDTVEIFVQLQSVQPKKDMKVARSMFATATCTGDKPQLFVVGGIDHTKEEIKHCEVFDLKQNVWT